MKRTKLQTVVATTGKYGYPVYRRVYTDEDGKMYVREKGDYVCIEKMPCRKLVTSVWG